MENHSENLLIPVSLKTYRDFLTKNPKLRKHTLRYALFNLFAYCDKDGNVYAEMKFYKRYRKNKQSLETFICKHSLQSDRVVEEKEG